MRQRTLLFLFVILLLGIGAFYVDFGFGRAPSINLLGYQNNLNVNLGLDLKGGVQMVMQASCPSAKPNCDYSQYMSSVVDNINRRIAGGLAVNDAVVRLEGTGSQANRVLIELPGLTEVKKAEDLLGTTGQMNIIDTGSTQLQVGTPAPACPANANPCPSGTYKVVFTGSQLDASQVSAQLNQNNQPVVLFAFAGNAKGQFGTYTGSHIQQYLTITLDDKVIESAVIRSEIDGQGEIDGIPNIEQAQNLASLLRYGALPLALHPASENVLAPTLGQQALDASKRAAIIGLGMVMLFMLIYYRLPGLLADVALCLYALFLFAVIKLMGVTLSLPGIAAVILTIGMAVDANVLIFERVKEELRSGRTMAAAIDIGFKRAWPSIRDSNASTMITCGILYWFGNNFGATIIVGFAVNLFIGVAISLFTAVVVTRNFLNVLTYFGIATHPALYGLSQSALPISRYNRPVSRVSARPGRPVIAPSRPAEPELVVDEDEEVAADDIEAGDEDAMEQVGNTTNGRVPASSRSGASGTTQGTEE